MPAKKAKSSAKLTAKKAKRKSSRRSNEETIMDIGKIQTYLAMGRDVAIILWVLNYLVF